ncbi:MAG: DUF5998 family protein [Ornithinimicrobium sp.]
MNSMPRSSSRSVLPDALRIDIENAGYLPAVVDDVVAASVGADPVVAHLVHQEMTFDAEAVRRHMTVLVLTEHRLVIGHADDHESDQPDHQHMATVTTEVVPLRAVRGVMVTHVIPEPEKYAGGLGGRAATLTLGWGAVSRVDLVPAVCGDPQCEGDHGYEGSVAGDDISLRVAADSEGEHALANALDFAAALSSRLGR